MLAHPASPRRGGVPTGAPSARITGMRGGHLREPHGQHGEGGPARRERGGGAGRRGDRVPDHRHRPEGAGRGRHRVHRHLGRRAGALRSAPGPWGHQGHAGHRRQASPPSRPTPSTPARPSTASPAVRRARATVVSRTLLRRDRPRWASPSSSPCRSTTACPRVSDLGPQAPPARLGESPCVPRPAEPSSGRWPLSSGWCSWRWPTSVAATTGRPTPPPTRPARRCPTTRRGVRRGGSTDPEDLAVDRTLARCEGARTTAARPPCGWRSPSAPRPWRRCWSPRPSTSSRPTARRRHRRPSRPRPTRAGSGRGRRGGRRRGRALRRRRRRARRPPRARGPGQVAPTPSDLDPAAGLLDPQGPAQRRRRGLGQRRGPDRPRPGGITRPRPSRSTAARPARRDERHRHRAGALGAGGRDAGGWPPPAAPGWPSPTPPRPPRRRRADAGATTPQRVDRRNGVRPRLLGPERAGWPTSGP